MARTMGSREARKQFSQLLGEVHFGGQTVIITRSGRPMVAMIPVADYEQLVAGRQVRTLAGNETRRQTLPVPVQESERDHAETAPAGRVTGQATKRQEYVRRLEDTVQRIVSSLALRPEVQRVILFGSYAEGRRDLLTDLDILIVMDSPLDFVTRTAEMYRFLSAPVDMDLLVYTPEELERSRGLGFIRRVLEKGTILYEKESD